MCRFPARTIEHHETHHHPVPARARNACARVHVTVFNTIARAAVVCCALASSTRGLFGQTPPLPYWQHSQWIGENAPPLGGLEYLARSADGYLWIGAFDALMRFDGIRYTVFDSTNTPAMRGAGQGGFIPMVLDKRGTLWIRGPGGTVLSYAEGVMTRVFPFESEATGQILEDRAGRVWINTRKGMRLFEHGRLVAIPLPNVPDTSLTGATPDTADGLWIGTTHDGLLHVQRNRVERFGRGSIRALLQSRDGVVWAIGDGLGRGAALWRLVDGRFTEVHPPGEPSRSIISRIAVEGADGSVWFVTADMGLLRWHNGRMERYSKEDGLSNNRVGDIYADSEGAVWVSTDAGLDRLRPSVFASIEKRNGMPYDGGGLFAEDTSGGIWASSERWAYLLDGGIIRNRAGATTSKRVPISEDSYFQLISPSRAGGAWFGPGTGGILRLSAQGGAAYRARDGFPTSRIGIAFEASDGTLWTRSLAGDLGAFKEGKYKPVPIPPAERPAPRGIAEDAFGRIWFASAKRRVTVLSGDSIVSRFALPPSGGGDVTGLAAEGGDTMWVATHATLVRLVGERVATVTPLGLERVLFTVTQLAVSRGFLWLASTGGFARIPLSELHRAADSGAAVTSVEVFGLLDGLTIAHAPTHVPTPMRVGKDGRVWVTTPNGLAVADPTFRMVTKRPRRVRIEEFSVGEQTMLLRDGETVAASPARISFRFTVPTLLLAERVRMQYRLDGADDQWVDASIPRVATYNRLGPGKFVFRVRAWDETGKFIPDEATLSFRVLPTWYQSWWFTALICAVAAGTLVLAYRLRVRQLQHAYSVRLEERTSERTRIARELHDTLLQNFQGLMFRFQAVREMLPMHPAEAIPVLDTALLRGEQAIDEARSAVSDLRSSENVERDFSAGLAGIVAEVVHISKQDTLPSCKIDLHGRIREIPPTVLYELYQVAREALCNAYMHARAAHVSLEVRYGMDSLRVTIADDGAGFDASLITSQRRPGHFGIQGMMERIERLGGALELNSQPHEGTRVVLSVPAIVAYRKLSPSTGVGTIKASRSGSGKAADD